LDAALEELRLADEVESIEGTVAVREFKSHDIRQVPIGHRRESPESAALPRTAVEVAVGDARDEFPRAWAACEDRACR
jgi:hypothetical protein